MAAVILQSINKKRRRGRGAHLHLRSAAATLASPAVSWPTKLRACRRAEASFTKFSLQDMTQNPEKSDQWDGR